MDGQSIIPVEFLANIPWDPTQNRLDFYIGQSVRGPHKDSPFMVKAILLELERANVISFTRGHWLGAEPDTFIADESYQSVIPSAHASDLLGKLLDSQPAETVAAVYP